MRDFAKGQLGLEFKFDALLNARIDCSRRPLTYRLKPEEVVALDVRFPERLAEHERLIRRELDLPTVPDSRAVYACGGGMQSFAIDPYGQMSICGLSPRMYSVRTGSVKAGWEFLAEARNTERKTVSNCVSCRLRSLCGMCPAYGELESGDAEQPVEFLCEVAHLRAAVVGIEVPEHGDCAFCVNGTRHGDIKEKARSIMAKRSIVSGSSTVVSQRLATV